MQMRRLVFGFYFSSELLHFTFGNRWEMYILKDACVSKRVKKKSRNRGTTSKSIIGEAGKKRAEFSFTVDAVCRKIENKKIRNCEKKQNFS